MRVGSRWEVLFDVVALVTVVAASVHLAGTADSLAPSSAWVALLLLAAGSALVAVRRLAPGVAAVGSVVASGAILLVPDSALAVWVLAEICLFSLPLRRGRPTSAAVGITHAVLLYGGAMITFDVGPMDPLALILPVWTGAVVAFGSALRAQQDYVDALEARTRTLAEAREIELHRRLSEERVRIARDLHDSVANSIAVLTLQAADAEKHLADDSARARAGLRSMRATAKRTLVELGEILTVLRRDEVESDRTLPSARSLPHLIDLFVSSGLVVEADLAEDLDRMLDAAGEAALYRVAQEALTNAQRHGVPPVTVRTALESDAVVIEVTNPTVADRRRERRGFGFGLVGMRERVELSGGHLEIDELDGRFQVTARLPRVSVGATP